MKFEVPKWASVRSVVKLFLFVIFVFSISVRAHNKVVVVPLGGDEKSSLVGEATISIPVTSLLSSTGEPLNFSSSVGSYILLGSVNTTYGTSFVIPQDHKAGTRVYLDVHVYNLPGSSPCQPIITTGYSSAWRPGEARDQNGVFVVDGPSPSFTAGDQTGIRSFRFSDSMGAGDAIVFGISRLGDVFLDTCPDVALVGMQVRYQRE